jgi:DNA N-6-adenine-methyltransferase (Dam)
MSARISSGKDSRQDYATPPEFIAAVERKFGPIQFDLAAHAGNAKHARYFAPITDPQAYGVDAFAHQWFALSRQFPDGPLWLNCEFNAAAHWAKRCAFEATFGANILLLTPVAITNWFYDYIVERADVYLLKGRLCFDGKSPFPKDCMLSHFHPHATGAITVWDWKKGTT